MLKGAIHIHSTYSDGEFTLAQLREVYMALGCDFVCMTDHAEYFDAAKIKSYIDECRSLSDESFRFITGLEYTCDNRMHVLGYGVTSPVATTNPQKVIRHIKNEGGISVIAHPMDSAFEWIESFEELPDAIEVWNSKYDGRYAPRPETFRLLVRLQTRSPQMRAFYGQDMHWKKQHRGLFNIVVCKTATGEKIAGEEIADEEILAAFARGNYYAVKENFELPSSGMLSEDLLARFGSVNRRDARKRQLIKRAKKMIDRVGLTVPAPLKAQLRRIF
ncbi:MAG: PHP domain-containing protein [Blastocatellia bacterium]